MSTRQVISKLVYSKARKPVIWLGASRAAVQEFPRPARKAAGHALLAVQCGLSPPDTKTMSSIGPGVAEIRVHVGGEFRVIYVAKHVEAVYVLHAFEKRTQRTRQGELELARTRLRAAERSRRAQGEPRGRHHRDPIKW
jgi:phage-related protein